MAKYSVDLSINTQGYTEGIDEAKQQNAQFTSSVVNADKSITSMQKELGKAKREVKNLAMAYRQMSKEEKNSASGKALQVQLAQAKKAAAELIDLNADVTRELKNMASDTAGWDAMKEGIGIAKDGLSALAVVVGDATGNEKAFKEVIAQVAKIQMIANTAISVGNALQKQSAILGGIRTLQEKALTKAITMETTATKGATVAQRIFNTVAKANPYVLLATAILTAAAAVGTFIAFTHKSTAAQEKENEEAKKLEEVRKAGADAYKNTVVDLLSSYGKLREQWASLKTEGEKIDWIKKNQTEFNKLGISIKNIKDAEKWLVENTNKVVTAFNKRAEAAAHAARIQKLYAEKLDEEDKILAIQEKYANKRANLRPQMNVSMDDQLANLKKKENDEILEVRKAQHGIQQKINAETKKEVTLLQEAETLLKTNNKTGSTNTKTDKDKKTKEQITELERLEKEAEKTIKAIKSIPPVKLNTEEGQQQLKELQNKLEKQVKDIQDYRIKIGLDPDPNSIDGLQRQISDLEASLRKGIVPDEFPSLDEAKKKLKELKEQKVQAEIEWGFKEPEEKIKELEKTLEENKKDLKLAYDSNDQEAINAAQKAVYEAQQAVNEEKIKIKIVAELSLLPEELEKLKQDIQQELYDIEFDGMFEQEWDFSGFSGSMQKECEKAVKYYNNLKDEIKTADKIINDPSRTEGEKQIAQERKKHAEEQLAVQEKTLNQLQDESNKLKEQKETYQYAGEALGSMASALSSLGDAFGSQELKVAGIIAQTIATLLLGYAKATTAAAETGNPFVWVAFVAAGLATVAATIAQIKQMTAGSYAEGGIIPGSSYAGDRLTANVNSGEMILNKKQQKNLFDIANKGLNATDSKSIVYVEGKIRGKDLLLVQKNFNTIGSKSGQNIKI